MIPLPNQSPNLPSGKFRVLQLLPCVYLGLLRYSRLWDARAIISIQYTTASKALLALIIALLCKVFNGASL